MERVRGFKGPLRAAHPPDLRAQSLRPHAFIHQTAVESFSPISVATKHLDCHPASVLSTSGLEVFQHGRLLFSHFRSSW
jgi:hypothetical protein